VEIPKEGGKVRLLSIPSIRDRVVQGALKLILEPIFEADFQPGSYGYRPKRKAHQAVDRVARAIVVNKTRVINLDLKAYFDNVRHHVLLTKVARRVNDGDVMRLLKMILKATGDKGVPQGGVISPLLSNIYLNEVDRMLERAREATREGRYTHVEYARFADDLAVLVDAYRRHDWLLRAVDRRLREELAKLEVQVNREESDGRPDEGGDLWIPGVRLQAGTKPRGPVAGTLHAPDRAANGSAQKAPRGLRGLEISAHTGGHPTYQPDSPGLGQLLGDRSLQSVLLLRPGLGREEGASKSDAVQKPPRLRLEEVE